MSHVPIAKNMTPVNIKSEVKELEAKGEKYETQVTAILDGDNNLSHKHIFIPALNKHYARKNDLTWHLLANDEPCPLC